MTATFTIVIKAKNEETQLADAIESAHLLSQNVIVVDDGSTDGTREVALSLGAVVLPGEPHGGQIDLLDKQGFAAVQSGWIVRMDADERLTPALVQEFRRIAAEGRSVGARFARLHYMFGAPVRHGGWFEPHQLAFFRADSWDRGWRAEMHSQVPILGAVETIPPAAAHSLHFDYDRVGTFVKRSLLRYAHAEAVTRHAAGERFTRRLVLVAPIRRLFGRYLIRQGFRDGSRGLVLAGLLACYDLSVACHLWEIEKQVERV